VNTEGFNGESNHVHLLVNFPPKMALSKLVNSLKGVSSRRMRQEFPDLVRHYYRANTSCGRVRTSRGPWAAHR
jgi:REP element-mobilizing transposase RayT